MADVCPSCSSSNIINEDHGGQNHRICSDCGEVIESTTSFEQDRDYWSGVKCCSASGPLPGGGVGQLRYMNMRNPNGPSQSLRVWIKYVKEVCSMIKVSDQMERAAVDLFTRAFNGSQNRKMSLAKHALCGAILYTVCRQEDWPVTVVEIASVVQSSVADLCKMTKSLASEFNIHTISVGIEEKVATVLKKYGINDKAFVERTVEVVSLAKDAWITCGRSRDPVIVAAAFIVWKSSPEGRGKSKKMPSFCRHFKLGKPPGQTGARIREIRGSLMQLLERLPWLKTLKIDREMTSQYLDDVLQHKKYLFTRVKLPKEEDSDDGDNDKTETPETDLEITQNQTASVSNLQPISAAGPLPSWIRSKKRKQSFADDSDEESNGKTARTKEDSWDPQAISSDEELTERDMPESEVQQYLRSDKEVAELEQFQQALAQDKST